MSIVAKILAIAIPGAIQFVTGNIIQPRFMGSALDLHPVIVLMALIFFGMIWGIVGAFLAVPITAVIRIVLEKIPDTRPVAELLAGRLDAFAEDRSSSS
jgi:AI-2 transport protein TqsA